MAKEADSSFAEALANLGLSALLQRLQEQGFQKVEELVYLKVEYVTALLSAEPLLTLRDKRVFENLWETLKQSWIRVPGGSTTSSQSSSSAATQGTGDTQKITPPAPTAPRCGVEVRDRSPADRTIADQYSWQDDDERERKEDAISLTDLLRARCAQARSPARGVAQGSDPARRVGTGRHPTKIALRNGELLLSFLESQGVKQADQTWKHLPAANGYQFRIVDGSSALSGAVINFWPREYTCLVQGHDAVHVDRLLRDFIGGQSKAPGRLWS